MAKIPEDHRRGWGRDPVARARLLSRSTWNDSDVVLSSVGPSIANSGSSRSTGAVLYASRVRSARPAAESSTRRTRWSRRRREAGSPPGNHLPGRRFPRRCRSWSRRSRAGAPPGNHFPSRRSPHRCRDWSRRRRAAQPPGNRRGVASPRRCRIAVVAVERCPQLAAVLLAARFDAVADVGVDARRTRDTTVRVAGLDAIADDGVVAMERRPGLAATRRVAGLDAVAEVGVVAMERCPREE